MIPRGIRNHNPGNIKDTGIAWRGILPRNERNADQVDEGTFVVFRGPWWGLRAMAMILRNYSVRHGIDTVAGIINRWAPGSDNNPHGYAPFVARKLDVSVDDHIDVTDYDIMYRLLKAIVQFENGADPYSWEYQAGLILAGIEPPPDSLEI